MLSITVFVTQLVFIGCRNWNVHAIASHNLGQIVLSGAIVHLSWLVSIAIGSISMYEIIANFELKYLPVICSSLSGGVLGSVLAYIFLKRPK